MDADAPGLSVGLSIDTQGAFANVLQFAQMFDQKTVDIIRQVAQVEKATGGMVKLGPATASMVSFGNAATRELQNQARELSRNEGAINKMIGALDREAALLGKTKEQQRAARVEELALTAARLGNTDAADRLYASTRQLDQAQKADQESKEAEARAVREAALAYQMFETKAREGLAALRETEAAAERDAVALARLRAMIDPAAAAQEKLNRDLSEARRLFTAAGASAEELAQAESMLADRMYASTRQHDEMGKAAKRNGFALQQVAIQMPDIVQGLLTGQKPMTVFIQQGGQLVQIAQMAEGGIKGFAKELALLGLRFAPALAAIAAAGAGMALFVRWVNQGVTNDQLTRDLGKITGGANATKQELYKLREETVTWGDVTSALFSEIGKDIAGQFTSDMKAMGKNVKDVLDDLASYAKKALAGIYTSLSGTRAYLGEVEKGGWRGIGKMLIGQGDPDLLKKTYGKQYQAAIDYLDGLGDRVRTKSVENARKRLADKIGYNAPKTDAHAAALARDAEAIEAQIRNLYMLADAYGVSGAAALIAEARVKAESKAIRQRGDVEAAVAREVRLAVAQRIADAAKGTAGMRDQAAMQEGVNAAVAAGNVHAALANEMLRDRLADLPLLAALEAAQKVKDAKGIAAATKALDEQRAARDRLTDAERQAAIGIAMQGGRDRLEQLREEARLIGASEEMRARELAILRATQDAAAAGWNGPKAAEWIAQQGDIATKTAQLARDQAAYNDELAFTADRWDIIAGNVQNAARGMADAFGEAGRAIGDLAATFATYNADRERLELQHREKVNSYLGNERAIQRENAKYALATSTRQIGMFGDMATAARGFFDEQSAGYKGLTVAVQVFRAIEFALSVKAMAMDAVETAKKLATSAARTAAHAVEAVVKAIASLPFPANLAAGAATVAALAAMGVSIAGGFGGSRNNLPKANDGTGTVLGDVTAKSESVKRAIDALRDVDLLMLNSSREMAASLRSIEHSIGGVASLVVRAGNVNADAQVAQGFKPDLIGSVLGKIPLIGGILGGLFGSTTSVIGNGLFAGPQSLSSILSGGFDASYYSDIEKKKKFLGIVTGKSYSTQYSAADAGLEQQFGLILRQFNDAIRGAAAPLGVATGEIEQRLGSFVVNLGKIDLKGLTGAQIEEKLSAIFGAAADQMASAAIPGLDRFQKVGEGAFETLVRVASTVEAVTATFDQLGYSARGLGIDAKMGVAAQFDSIGDYTKAAGAYFDAFYTPAEQNAAKLAQMAKVFVSLGTAMPDTLSAFRGLVEAQDLTTAAGQKTYATLLQLAPAFADLKGAMEGAKSAADILAERQDLERKLLEMQGDTAAIRALDLAKLDASNRALQQQIWAMQDAQEAAKAADELRKAWTSVGDSIMDEVKRIRGLTGTGGNATFADLMGQFNAATSAARGGDQEAAKLLPGLSQALLKAAGDAATSRQELDRVQAQTAASLEATWSAIQRFGAAAGATSADRMAAAMAVAPGSASSGTTAANDTAAAIAALREEVAAMRRENAEGHAATASNTGRMARKLDDVTAESGGDAISVRSAA